MICRVTEVELGHVLLPVGGVQGAESVCLRGAAERPDLQAYDDTEPFVDHIH